MTDGQFLAPKRNVRRVFLHCSAWDDPMAGWNLVAEIRRWHTDPKPKGNGWNDIGYHYVIDKEGVIMPGRSLETTPAAQLGNNRATIAICVHGLTFADTWPHGAQAAAVINLAGQINAALHGIVGWWPHNAVSNRACPVFDVTKLLGLDRWRRMP